ncbi:MULTISPECIES: D-glycero-beta-D-manno-heptose 1-phosphate adenylyltransferase [Streptomyces]|uniref:D-glycero-beta-D-manno-heptose 1-phosphate adenylyltransferase n=2 Tax=Streptomyces TaxID=1883 RepID=A0A2U9PE57_STRAS|nr:D-glycero-beta-D-manno-heptose 1-phosphate adenylyltransferase [Streptomyces actuosus]AWT47853.1 D-glycero-beta-D-manno-heptose 1-phosphate adenylyltransferase [Streptomyces actuosus]MBM4822864.1 D-glycero-beta-D-manno-heptose 1-phosphate adenylyltransferase [Streptomyces actuosus]
MSGARKAPLVVVGDALLDRDLTGTADRLAPDAPVPVVADCAERLRPGGAALAACLAARDGRDVTLITGLGDDEASEALRALLDGRVRLIALPLTGPLPEKTRVLARGRPVVRLDRGDGRARAATDEAREALRAAPAVLVADYGRGAADALRAELTARPPAVWDPHPRGGPPVPGVRLVTPARAEAAALAARAVADSGTDADTRGSGTGTRGSDSRTDAGDSGAGADIRDSAPPDDPAPGARAGGPHGRGAGAGRELRDAARDAGVLVRHWRAGAVAVTLGERGVLLSYGEHPLLVPAPVAHHGDPCGAGDAFAATAAGLLADGALVGEAVEGAVAAATAFVGEGGAAALRLPDAPRPTAGRPPSDAGPVAGAGHVPGAGQASGTGHAVRTTGRPTGPAPAPAAPEPFDDPFALVARVRAAGGTVVATGGCFDLLHAGHVGLLQAARRIGDCLVVCVNSDDSVRRRKGAGRPVNPLDDRVRVLRALACVDAVAVFDEDTPERLLADLRPDVWVKGGDYAGADLPEAALLQEWGGQAVLLPYLDGRSSTSLLARAARGGAR